MFDMSNFSSKANGTIQTVQPVYFIAMTTSVVTFFGTAWLTTGLVTLGIRKKTFKNVSSNSAKVNAALVHFWALLATASCFFPTISNFALYNLGYGSNNPLPCEIANDFAFMTFVAQSALSMVFYWFRQRALYQHPVMEGEYNDFRLKVVQRSCIFLLCIAKPVAVIVFVSAETSATAGLGCALVNASQLTTWPLYLAESEGLIGQLVILGLFIYPLRKQVNRNNRDRIRNLYLRSAVITIITVILNNNALIWPQLVTFGPTRHGVGALLEFTLLINTMGVSASFESWRNIFFFPCVSSSHTKRKTDTSTQQGTRNTLDA